MLATKGSSIYPPVMSLKGAATFAFIGTLLAAALLIYYFVFDIISLAQGLIPLVTLFPAFIYALAALSLTVFLVRFPKNPILREFPSNRSFGHGSPCGGYLDCPRRRRSLNRDGK